MQSFLEYVNMEIDYLKTIERICVEYTGGKRPADSLVLRSHGGRLYYYRRKHGDSKLEALGGPDSETVLDMKTRRFMYERLKIVRRNLKLLNYVAKTFEPFDPASISSQIPDAYRDLPSVATRDPAFAELARWARAGYDGNGKPFQSVALYTCDGTRVRSKSEVIIYDLLKSKNIPFRYEPNMRFTDAAGIAISKSPDFLIKIGSDAYIIWEHFGMLQHDNYYDDFCNKIRLYHSKGYSLGKNLILTSDDIEGGADALSFTRIIEMQILPLLDQNGGGD